MEKRNLRRFICLVIGCLGMIITGISGTPGIYSADLKAHFHFTQTQGRVNDLDSAGEAILSRFSFCIFYISSSLRTERV